MQIDLTLDSSDDDTGPPAPAGRPASKPWLPWAGHGLGDSGGGGSSMPGGSGSGSQQQPRFALQRSQQGPAAPRIATIEDLDAYLASRAEDAAPKAHQPPAAAAAAAAERRARGPLSEVQPPATTAAAPAADARGSRNSPPPRAGSSSGGATADAAGARAPARGGCKADDARWEQYVERMVAQKVAGAVGGAVLGSDSSSSDDDGGGDEQGAAALGRCRGGAAAPAPPPPAKRRRGGGASGVVILDDSGEEEDDEDEGEQQQRSQPRQPRQRSRKQPWQQRDEEEAGEEGGRGGSGRGAARAASGGEYGFDDGRDLEYDPAAAGGCEGSGSDGDGDFEPSVKPPSVRGGGGGGSGGAAPLAGRGQAGGGARGVGSGGGAGSGAGGSGAGGSGGGAAKRRGRKTDEERAAEAEAKEAAKLAKKEAQQRAREEKAAAKIADKARRGLLCLPAWAGGCRAPLACAAACNPVYVLAKEHQRMSDRQAAGNLYEREIVVSLPDHFARSALGLSITSQLQERRWAMWRALPPGAPQPLADALREIAGGGGSGGGGGARGDGGCAVITFQRRKLSPADVRSVPASTELTEPFEESAPVPCLLLLFHQPAAFVAQLCAPGGGLRRLLGAAAAAHPACSLQALVVGLDPHLKSEEARDYRAGGASFRVSEVAGEFLRLQLAVPALQLRKVPNAEDAARHVLSLARALGQQPYKRTERDDALVGAGGGGGGSFEAAAATGMGDLGPGARRFGRCLARVQGIGGGQVWAICREFGGLGALAQAFRREAAAGRDPSGVVSGLRDARPGGKQRRLGAALGARLAALLTETDPDALVGHGDDA
ncbi:MAG: hypothetical protein J3K34DRAFT_492195 [Monoraphidium minutum]|nr:MAG: hypothetical protein J3K34DRAFT_492195 [Monoraphidium minutum]